MSDHFSGPRALAGPLCDICDTYIFPSPEKPHRLVLVINVLPYASASAVFSDAIIYRFRLRPLTIAAVGPAARFAMGDKEITFDCTFDSPRSDAAGAISQRGTCVSSKGDKVSFQVHDVQGGGGNGLRVFAGVRSDPFFVDVAAYKLSLEKGQVSFRAPGESTLSGANVLSVVVEVDCATLLREAGGPLFAFVGETVAAGKLPIRLERVGRPEVKNVMLSPQLRSGAKRKIDLRDLYNLEDPFHLGPDYRQDYSDRLNENLAVFDSLDGKIDWPLDADGMHPLTRLLLDDFLVVDASQPFAEDSFFEIEQATLDGREHKSSGGRSLNDDVLDTLYTVLIGGGKGPRISDYVDQATQRASRNFPYLAPPNPPSAGRGGGGPSRGTALDSDHDHHHHYKFGRFGW